MSKRSPHYLELELYDRIKTDPEIFDFLQEGSLDGLWYWDLEKAENEWMSERFWHVLGYDPSTMPHSPDAWREIIDPDDLETATRNFEKHCRDKNHPYDQLVRYRHADGSTITVRCRGIAIRDDAGNPVRMLGAHNNVTAYAQAKADAAARVRAEFENRMKTVFLANISHEIRTPLNSLLGIAEALQNTALSDRQAEMLTDLRLAGGQLHELLSDVLDMARIEAGEMSMEHDIIDPIKLIDAIAATFRTIAQSRGLGLSVKHDVGADWSIIGSEKRIRQVAYNLISNAIKFTPEGEVVVDISVSDPTSDNHAILTIKVVDTGPGVPDDMKEMIFERFQQGDDQSNGGSGLGLSIATTICAAHGGSLTIVDARGGGAEFIATFLVRMNDGDSAAQKELPPGSEALPQDLSILVAEDVLLNRRSLKHILYGSSIDLSFATNGEQALQLIKQERFDAALIDIRMPLMNGIDVVRAYRVFEAEESIRHMPIIACSANVLRGQIDECTNAGFDAFLAKPFNLAQLVAALAESGVRREGV